MTGYQFSDSEGYNADAAADFAAELAEMTDAERDAWEDSQAEITRG